MRQLWCIFPTTFYQAKNCTDPWANLNFNITMKKQEESTAPSSGGNLNLPIAKLRSWFIGLRHVGQCGNRGKHSLQTR